MGSSSSGTPPTGAEDKNAPPANRILPSKDAANFRAMLRLYEQKQYKKAIKTADAILKKHPKHGETMAMKGLLFYFSDKKDEGRDLIKQGLQYDMTSFVCWHVYGLYYRSERNFEEAAKCYQNALKYDPDNSNILRDLSILQIQMRQFKGYVVSRNILLQQRPASRPNWTALALGQHLTGRPDLAVNVLSGYEDAIKQPIPRDDSENWELLLYKNSLIYETGDVAKALTDLDNISNIVLDQHTVIEFRAKYLLDLKRYKEALVQLRKLLDRNPENYEHYKSIQSVLGIENSDQERVNDLYNGFIKKYPDSNAALRLSLDVLDANDYFKNNLKKYLDRYLSRGMPSTFVSLKPLYVNKEKLPIILEIIGEYEKRVMQDKDNSNGAVWILHFLAQHYDFLNDRDKAKMFVEKALEIDAKVVEVEMIKGKLAKHRGDLVEASKSMTIARELDVKDRFINSKAAKYLLRNDEIDKAIDVVSLFTKNDATGKGVNDLHEMQCFWFLYELGAAHNRIGDKGMALKRFSYVVKIFEDCRLDEVDFHPYLLRRGAMRAYIDLMKWDDHLFKNLWFILCGVEAIKIYLGIFDERERADSHNNENGNSNDDGEFKGLSDAEKKKAKKRAKRERAKELKKEHEALESAEINAAEGADKAGTGVGAINAPPKDPDPLGKKLLLVKDPLEPALKILKHLEDDGADQEITWEMAFEIQLRSKKYLLALGALNKAIKLRQGLFDNEIINGWIAKSVSILKDRIAKETNQEIVSDQIRKVISMSLSQQLDKSNLDARGYIDNWYSNQPESCAKAKLILAETIHELSSSNDDEAIKLAQQVMELQNVTLQQSLDGLQLIGRIRSQTSNEYQSAAKAGLKQWPESSRLLRAASSGC